jgi:hypothetical protein
VFTILNDGICEKKLAQCNNCGQLHSVVDLCRSEFLSGKDETSAIPTEIDIGLSISSKLKSVLEVNKCDISLWEQAEFYEENEMWGSKIILSKERTDDSIQIKSLHFISKDKFKIKSDTFQEAIGE